MLWLTTLLAAATLTGEPLPVGNALFSAGMYMNAQETSAPAPRQYDQQIIDHAMAVGALSGAAEACGLDWEPNYEAFIGMHRRRGMQELDLLFMGAYHGVAQGDAYNIYRGHCTDDIREQTRSALEINIRQLTQ